MNFLQHNDIDNPGQKTFGAGSFAGVARLIGQRSYCIVSYPEPYFATLMAQISAKVGAPVAVIADVAPNPDFALLEKQAARLHTQPEVIVAIGGGSVIDTAKVLASANGDFARVQRFLTTKSGEADLTATPIIAVPTTAGTGSEVTCWATVWDNQARRKYSLNRRELYPEHAVIDPALMLGKSRQLTIATGLDALSHSLESLWNVNASPGSAFHAIKAATAILKTLPELLENPGSLELRTTLAEASLNAGLAFSQTKTAIAHSLSYPISLHHGVVHGIACSFTLPIVLQAMAAESGLCGQALRQIFGPDLSRAPQQMQAFLNKVGVSGYPADYGVTGQDWQSYVSEAFQGERGLNFIGNQADFHKATATLGLI